MLSASRLDRAKRIDLLLEAAAATPGFDVVVASDGPDRERLEAIAHDSGLDGRVRFEGRVSAERLAELYATCSSVFYAPVDEDFGMGPYEAFLSGKPVITTTDAGGPLDVVHDRRTGLVVAPEAPAIGQAAAWLRDHDDEAAALGVAGQGAGGRGDLGSGDREAALVRVGYFSPMPPEASGIADYSALLASCAPGARRGRGRRSAARSALRVGSTSPYTTSATTPRRTAGSSTRSAGRRASSCSTTSFSITSSRA